jgi:hypothetical protein
MLPVRFQAQVRSEIPRSAMGSAFISPLDGYVAFGDPLCSSVNNDLESGAFEVNQSVL